MIAEREVGVVRPPEHAVGAERDAIGPRRAEIAPHLRRGAAVAQYLDIDRHRSAVHRRAEDGVGRHQLQIGTREVGLHRAQRRRHGDATERVHHLPGLGNGTVVPAGKVGVGLEGGVAEQVAGRDDHGQHPPVSFRSEITLDVEWLGSI